MCYPNRKSDEDSSRGHVCFLFPSLGLLFFHPPPARWIPIPWSVIGVHVNSRRLCRRFCRVRKVRTSISHLVGTFSVHVQDCRSEVFPTPKGSQSRRRGWGRETQRTYILPNERCSSELKCLKVGNHPRTWENTGKLPSESWESGKRGFASITHPNIE